MWKAKTSRKSGKILGKIYPDCWSRRNGRREEYWSYKSRDPLTRTDWSMTRPGRFVDPCTRAYIYLSRYYLDKKDFQNVELYAKKCLGLVQTREHGNQMLKIITEMSGKKIRSPRTDFIHLSAQMNNLFRNSTRTRRKRNWRNSKRDWSNSNDGRLYYGLLSGRFRRLKSHDYHVIITWFTLFYIPLFHRDLRCSKCSRVQ